VTEKTKFLNVILPLALPNLYTYRVPREFNDTISLGKRVVVQFGRSKVYSALIAEIHSRAPENYEAKYILSVLDDAPIVVSQQFKLWTWMASYYMCTQGEVMNAAFPSGLKLTSETILQKNLDFDAETSILSDKEYLIYEALEIQEMLSIAEVIKILNQNTVLSLIKSLIEKGAIRINEGLVMKYKPKTVTFVKLSAFADEEEHLKIIFDKLEKAPKQLEKLISFINHSKRYSGNIEEVAKKTIILETGSLSGFAELVKKEIFEVYEKEVSRLSSSGITNWKSNAIVLSESQESAFKKVKGEFENKDVVLLHGVTSSGKTEIYIKLIDEQLKKGKQVLYLLPEIALTTQIINRLSVHYEGRIGVYHSKYSDNERVEIWNSVLGIGGGATYDIILGARSALFLPFNNLGLVIIDEEHENTFKQYDPAPRYHARDSAIYLASIHRAKTLLGTATPSMESYSNAKNGKYGLVELFERFGNMQMPEILLVNVKDEIKKKNMNGHFSPLLMELMTKAFDKKEQVILFQNRRGFSPFLECHLCGWIPNCVHCDVTLTYHKNIGKIRCHYCGYSLDTVVCCSACGDNNIQAKGFGTEQIAEELSHYFPNAKISRMDLDTTRVKNAYQRIIGDFEKGKVDVLVGTQMVTKGLDFDNVSVVGVLSADSMLGYPDFRSYERSYQLMSQVGGRAGRKHKRGKVVIQTYQPDHHVILNVFANDYNAQFTQEMKQRKQFDYPPFSRLIGITIKHKDKQLLDGASEILVKALKLKLGKRVLGPEYPAISRIRNLYLKKVLIKLEISISPTKVKNLIKEEIIKFHSEKDFKSVRILLDVDPL